MDGSSLWPIIDTIKVFVLFAIIVWLLMDAPKQVKTKGTLPIMDYILLFVGFSIMMMLAEDMLSADGRLNPLIRDIMINILASLNQNVGDVNKMSLGLLGTIKMFAALLIGGTLLIRFAVSLAKGKPMETSDWLNALVGFAVVAWATMDLASPDSSIQTAIDLFGDMIVSGIRASLPKSQ